MIDEVLVVYDMRLEKKPTEYALSTLLSMVGTPFGLRPYNPMNDFIKGSIVISYGPVKPKTASIFHVHIFSSSLFEHDRYLLPNSIPEAPIYFENLCVFFLGGTQEPFISNSEGKVRTTTSNLDIFASAFFLLTRYEEFLKAGPLDVYERFPASSSILFREGLLHRPLVNEYADLLQQWILRVVPRFRFRQPTYRGCDFALALTRDLDSLHKFAYVPRRRIVQTILKGEFSDAVRLFRDSAMVSWLGYPDPYNNVAQIVAWERSIGVRSSIYVMGSRAQFDANYDAAMLHRSVAIEEMFEEGWEFGFHPGYATADNFDTFMAELAVVKKAIPKGQGHEILGGRQHYLKFRVPYTWRMWEKAGLQYDSTLGFADHEGFRSGACVPFRPFDLIAGRVLDLWELPLTLMDCTLTFYRKLSGEECDRVLNDLLSSVKRFHGVFVLLWHNTFFGRDNCGLYHDTMIGLIRKARDRGAYIGSPRDILSAATERNWVESGKGVVAT